MSIINEIKFLGLIESPGKEYETFLFDTELEVKMGSVAYGASMPGASDLDVHAICVPDKHLVFNQFIPNYIHGFSHKPLNFESFQQHHIDYQSSSVDVCIFSIVKLFALAAENNPNVLDLIWTPDDCHIHVTPIGKHILDNRKLFLNQKSYQKFTGYAFGQIKKVKTSKRFDLIEKYGYDVKHAYHIIRLALQANDILTNGDMDLRKHSQTLIDIRSGRYTFSEIQLMFEELDHEAQKLLSSTHLPVSADMAKLETVLLECLEMKYGSI